MIPPQSRSGIVHLGVGAFHRAHQAVYVEDALAAGERGWGIIAASLRQPDTRDALAPQDGLYTLAVRSAEGETLRVVGALRRIARRARGPSAPCLPPWRDPAIRIVTLTVTEKGYCHDPATGELERGPSRYPRRSRDRRAGRDRRTGFLVEALRLRRAAGIAPFTVVTCDNLPANGRTAATRRGAPREASSTSISAPSSRARSPFPRPWSTASCRRRPMPIAPASRSGSAVGDAWPVVTEPFTQWVIEDHFPQGRPRFEEFGAELVADVAPYETMKLRLLNASHSTLAYLGYLAGYETIAETMADEAFARLVSDLMDEEMGPTLSLPAGADVDAYKRSLIDRFRNPALRHRTWQIAMDGSQKLPQRLLSATHESASHRAPP